MKEQLVSYDTTALAVDLGFREIPVTLEYWDDSEGIRKCPVDHYPTMKDAIKMWVVTQSLLHKWLREEQSVNIVVNPLVNANETLCYTASLVSWRFPPRMIGDNFGFDTYEDAMEDALKEALTILIDKK